MGSSGRDINSDTIHSSNRLQHSMMVSSPAVTCLMVSLVLLLTLSLSSSAPSHLVSQEGQQSLLYKSEHPLEEDKSFAVGETRTKRADKKTAKEKAKSVAKAVKKLVPVVKKNQKTIKNVAKKVRTLGTGAIVGIVGGILGLVILMGIGYYCYKEKMGED